MKSATAASVPVLVAISASHFLNDIIQSLLPSIYPMLKQNFHLGFAQIGMITFTAQLTASLLQPVVGMATDRRPVPWSLACSAARLAAPARTG